jgi:hypothetical protein
MIRVQESTHHGCMHTCMHICIHDPCFK